MDVIAAPETSLPAAIRQAQEALAAAAQAGPVSRDPYRPILEAQARVLGVLGQTVTELIAARSPITPEEKDKLLQDLVYATAQGAQQGSFEGVRKEARRMIRTIDGALATRIALAIGSAYVLGALTVWAAPLLRLI